MTAVTINSEDPARHIYHLSPARLFVVPLLWAALLPLLLYLSPAAPQSPGAGGPTPTFLVAVALSCL